MVFCWGKEEVLSMRESAIHPSIRQHSAQESDPSFSRRSIVQRFAVNFEYPVLFTHDLFAPGNPVLPEAISPGASPPSLAIYLDGGLHAADPQLCARITAFLSSHSDLRLAGPIEIVAGGEDIKNDPHALEKIYRQLLKRRLDRHAYVVSIGGGSVLDLVGFAAATFHRGLRHIRVPTTVLAQNDAGIGVKNARNAFGVKNLIGSFQPPWAVIIDAAFLQTLPDREKRAGLAEAVKVALIRDRDFFFWLEENAGRLASFDAEALDRLIYRCAMLHMRQIATGGDPFELGNARPLDFGHWAAHKLESLSGHQLRHGEAVAMGLALDTRYSVLAELLPKGDERRVFDLLRRLGFSLWHPALALHDAAGRPLLLEGLREFREHLGGELSVTLLNGIGQGVEVSHIEPALVARAAGWLRRESGAAI